MVVAAPYGLIGKLVRDRHAPRHCKEAQNPVHGHCESGKAGNRARDASESGDRPHSCVVCADIAIIHWVLNNEGCHFPHSPRRSSVPILLWPLSP